MSITSATFLVSAPDQPGLVARLAGFFYGAGLNIVDASNHTDLLLRQRAGDLPCEIPLIISNHPTLESVARSFEIPFYCLPVTAETKAEQERQVLDLLHRHHIDLVVLARYMQILSDVARVTHAMGPEDMARLGRDVERLVLSRAVRAHLERRVIVTGRRTVVL